MTDRQALAELLRKAAERDGANELARRHLGDFCALMDPGFTMARHTAKIIEALEAVERGDINKLAIELPPRHGKSYLASERFPAWYMGRNGDRQLIIASYGAELAVQKARTARNLLEDDRSPFDVKVSQDSAAAHRWATTKGGVVIAAGVGGSLTGFGAHGAIIDDPVKDREDADSPTQSEKKWAWYQEILRTRLMRGSWQVLMQTRWGENDLAGRIRNSAGASDWFWLTLPLFAVENDPLGRAIGELLWPEGELPIPSVDKGEISSRGFQALYQQDPQPDTGLIFKREWLDLNPGWTSLPEMEATVLAIDCASKDGVTNDFSAATVWGKSGGKNYLIGGRHGRMEYTELKRMTHALIETYQPTVTVVEDTSSGTPLIQEMRRSGIPLASDIPKGKKEARAEAITPLFEAGLVVLPAQRSVWLDEWIGQHLRFGSGQSHDDYVDTSVMALNRLRNRNQFSFGAGK